MMAPSFRTPSTPCGAPTLPPPSLVKGRRRYSLSTGMKPGVDPGDERTRVQVFAMRSMASWAAFHRAHLRATQQAFDDFDHGASTSREAAYRFVHAPHPRTRPLAARSHLRAGRLRDLATRNNCILHVHISTAFCAALFLWQPEVVLAYIQPAAPLKFWNSLFRDGSAGKL
jgi:hypothetical protein